MYIISQFCQHNMHMDESIIITSIIDELVPSQKDYIRKVDLKHKEEEIEEYKLNCIEEWTIMSSEINMI